jgi:hypothetical protein
MSDNFSSLPANIQYYIDSNFGALVRQKIYSAYGVNNAPELAKIVDAVEEVYFERMTIADFVKVFAKLPLSSEASKKMAVDYLGKFLLVMDDYFDGQVSEQLKKLGANPEDFSADVDAMTKDWQVYKQKLIANGDLLPEDNEEINLNEEKSEIINQLSSDLSALLAPETNDGNGLMQEANWLLGYVMFNSTTAKQEFAKALINNQTLLNTATAQPESVNFWLTDFLSFVNGNYADNLLTARYFVESAKFKQLTEIDKKRVKNLIYLYRNINVFPANFNVHQPEQIQFFPVDLLQIKYQLEIGQPTTIVSKAEPSTSSVAIKKPVILASQRYQKITSQINKINLLPEQIAKLENKSLSEIVSYWQQAIASKDLIGAASGLSVMLKHKDFSVIWLATPEVKAVLSSLTSRYANIVGSAQSEGVISSAAMSLIIKTILENFNLTSEQSAIMFLQIVRSRSDLAAYINFNATDNEFTWRDFSQTEN